MEDGTPKPGETVTPKAPENGTPTPAPVTGNAGDAAEVEKLRKELEQTKMRANQLENENQKREKADAERKAKELEEQSEFKTLYEQEKAKREAVEAEREEKEKREAVYKAKAEALSGFSDEVKALAEEAGLALSSADEADVAKYKEKLEKIQTALGKTSKVGPNNPGRPTGQPALSQEELRMALKTDEGFAAEIAKRPGLAAMTQKR